MESLASAVITTHNRKDFLVKALRSALEQTYQNMEIIVVDDKSTDGTKEYMEEFVNSASNQHSIPIKYIYNSSEGGANKARNIGIMESKGEYIAFLDDDDEWMKEKTEKQVNYFNCHPDVGIVSCARVFEYNLKKRVRQDVNKLMEGDLNQNVFKRIPFTTSCMMVRRSLLTKVGVFDENLRYWQEYELLIRLCQETKVGVVKDHLTLYRKNTQDKNRLTNNIDGWEEAVQYIDEKHKVLIMALPEDIRIAHQMQIARDGAMRCEILGDKKRERKYLRQIMVLEPTMKNRVKFVLNRRKLRKD